MVFCNSDWKFWLEILTGVTILILIDGFLQCRTIKENFRSLSVTILILIDGFLQYQLESILNKYKYSHNPYFNRWFSAMMYDGMLTDFNLSHNPYFNRWFSAIRVRCNFIIKNKVSQSLF